MLIIPAIDILDGECVRLKQGVYEQKTVYGDNLAAIAVEFERQGADMIHIVDLDGAREGGLKNFEAILQIRKAVKIPIEVGGGMRTAKDVGRYLDAGIDRVVIGSKALDEDFVCELVFAYGAARIVAGIDILNDKIATQGWLKLRKMDFGELAKMLARSGITELVCTDVSRDGMLGAPNYGLMEYFVEAGFDVVASGGVTNVASVMKLQELGVSGVIIGKALYEGRLNITEIKSALF